MRRVIAPRVIWQSGQNGNSNWKFVSQMIVVQLDGNKDVKAIIVKDARLVLSDDILVRIM